MRPLLLTGALFAARVTCQNYTNSTSSSSGTYENPVLTALGADPWVTQDGEYYFLTYTMNTNITLLRSKVLTDWNNAESKLLYQPPTGEPYSTDLWAPAIHHISGMVLSSVLDKIGANGNAQMNMAERDCGT